LASISCPTLEQEIVRFIVPHRYAILSALGRKNAAPVNPSRGDGLAHDLTDRGLIVCSATDAHDAALRVPRSISNEWSESLLEEALE